MLIRMLKSKIHGATVTGADLAYEGSIAIDSNLLRLAGIYPGEMVQVYNVTNGQRFETYAIEGGEEQIVLNGAAARLAYTGDKIIAVAYGLVKEKEAMRSAAKIVRVDPDNRPI